MPNIKQAFLPYYSTGASGTYAIVHNVLTGLTLDNADGIFRALPADSHIPLTESPVMTSVYTFSESRSVWVDGQYTIFAYDSTDALFAGSDLFVLDDKEVSQADLLEYMLLIKKIEEGNWALDATAKTWTYFDTDGHTPLMTFNVYDQNGLPSVFNIFKRVRV